MPPRRPPITVVILAAGLGKRMKSDRPKVLAPLCGRPMISWVLDAAAALAPTRILLVVGHGKELVAEALTAQGQSKGVTLVHQKEQLGTGHALQVCRKELGKDPGRVVVLYGDMPLLGTQTLQDLVALQRRAAEGGAAILTACPDNARGFGRVLRGPNARVERIVEEKDCTPAQKAIEEVNTGVYVFDGKALVDALPRLTNDNAQKEYYLTDIVALMAASELPVVAHETEALEEIIGVNNLSHLSEARWALQQRILEGHLLNGVGIEDPATTTIDHGVQIGPGTRILPCTVIRSGVKIGAHCEVGPFTQLRTGTVLEDGAEIGNFTECKNARIGKHTKAKHLAYLGDVTIGERANVGAGTIFANYDGKHKHPTHVGDGAFLGSGTVVVAPNTIGARATTGAGAVVTRAAGVGAGETWVGVPARRLAQKKAGAKSARAAQSKSRPSRRGRKEKTRA
ncbi:MAG: bifunctional N-acetylglucosamine-1-phosphate uridyltransferase/glucosamine-1-phosphate acetyltransferase [Planctomycetes bacterium]|nr:bifunctional N-acetylglucosamine-1-phosphate uridyltransferase/glucosamine-1-phosphate acetyltransferase [Planctomycetota bacterium]